MNSPAKKSRAFAQKVLAAVQSPAQRDTEPQNLFCVEANMNSPGTNPVLARRDFIRSAGRYTLLAALAALGLVAARRVNAACKRNFACNSCPKFTGCTLPTAVEKRSQEVPT
jgi:hypothetical protein